MAQETQDRLARKRVETKLRLPGAVASDLVSRLPATGERRGEIVTVYLDRSDDLLSSRALANPEEAVKVRLRDYLDGAPVVWLEVKERRAGWVHKTRLPLARESIDAVLAGAATPVSPCRCDDCRRGSAEALERLGALARGPWKRVGAVAVRRRTLYFEGARVRVTLDEDVEYFRLDENPFAEGRSPRREVLAPALHRDSDAILEVKHGGDLPAWWLETAPPPNGAGPSKFVSLLRHLQGTGAPAKAGRGKR